MKNLFVSLLLFVLGCTAIHAQKRTFLRFYSLAGNKFQKGHLLSTTDSSVFIYKNTDTVEILAVNIGFIKTRRNLGHNVLVSAIVGAIPVSIIGAVTGEPNENNNSFGGIIHDAITPTPAEAAVGGLLLGGVAGAATGTLITLFTKSTTFIVNGSLSEWQRQKEIIDLLPAGK
ncbi:hypothetical protein FC093_08385 [Ilyomonas limi]|uniref:Uncharacterized protein n=1 Tax=Ilyomonas limi TaxID=2575867 RepID=A0A4V5UWK7_9BACT|nr:hypothetical protein [Ilyomonas limi]TKK69323.1 hypothetical protein FC093_08385 [Ilyomonas limi]